MTEIDLTQAGEDEGRTPQAMTAKDRDRQATAPNIADDPPSSAGRR